MKLYFDDESFDGQLQRSVGKCDSGMANVGDLVIIVPKLLVVLRVTGLFGLPPGSRKRQRTSAAAGWDDDGTTRRQDTYELHPPTNP